MNTRHISILLIVFILGGCASDLGRISHKQREVGIGYLDGKFKVCRENCPVPTPKEIDDTVPMDVLVSEMAKKSISMSVTTPVAEVKKQNVEKESVEPTATTQQHEIYFDFGMSRPNAEGESELRRFEESIRDPNNMEIDLVGRTDDIGTRKFNTRLARKRALNIATWIKARSIKARIALSTKAECCRAAPYDKRDKTFKEMRTVTIITRYTREETMKNK